MADVSEEPLPPAPSPKKGGGERGGAAGEEPLPPAPSPKKGGGDRSGSLALAASEGAAPAAPPLAPPPFLGEGVGGRGSSLAAATLFTLVAVALALAPGTLPDFFIYRAGSELARRGENPYDLAKIRALVAVRFPDENPTPESLVNNCGYFLPPQAVVLFLPFALLPFAVAKVAWALLHGVAALAIVQFPRLLRRAGEPLPPPNLVSHAVPFLLLLNFLALAVVMVGQCSVLIVGCVAGGLWCFARGGRWGFWAGVLLWSAAFVKPHVALALVPLAWYLGGWKRIAALVAVVAAFNFVGATIVGGSPLFLRDYLAYLSDSHRAVLFNRAALNPEVTSWNRLLYAATEPFAGDRFLIEQTVTTALASYLVWFGLLAGRCGASGAVPSAAWATAAAAVGAVLCPQVLGYEALMLLVAVPWVRELFAAGRRAWGWAAVALLGLQAVPLQAFQSVGFESHRPLGVALFALLVLFGPTENRAPVTAPCPPP